ncbi:Tyrosine recombinase XerC [subsurface metagenome]
MNDLILRDSFQKSCPTIVEGLKRAQSIFDSIKNFDDIERLFLKGNGLSEHTYRSYLTAVKQFYEFTNGLNPLQITAAHIESFYDNLVKTVDRNTACLRIEGLTKFFAGIRQVIPIYTTPFELMPEKLKKKLHRTKKGNRKKKALTTSEVKSLLVWLEKDTSEYGAANYSTIFMLVTSGLRSAELLQLKWKNIEMIEGQWTAYFIGKGGKDAEQELYGLAIDACIKYYRQVFRRDPRSDDALFWTTPRFPGDERRPLKNHQTLWTRIKNVGTEAKKAGIIKRDLVFSPHLFRRSYASALEKMGMPVSSIQKKTRHSNLETLAKHYLSNDEPAESYLDKMLT